MKRTIASRLLTMAQVIVAMTIVASSPATPARAGGDDRFDVSSEVATSTLVGRLNPAETIPFAFVLRLRNEAGLDERIHRIYDPRDPEYGHYLTPAQFADEFGRTQQEYDSIAQYAESHGFTVTKRYSNRLLLDVTGSAALVEREFGIHMMQYRKPDGRLFRSPDAALSVNPAISPILTGIVGLDDSLEIRRDPPVAGTPTPKTSALDGPDGAFGPLGITTAYGLTNTGLTGAGESIALFEQYGYNQSDITAYESYFGLTPVTVTTKLVDISTALTTVSVEDSLDIELAIAMAPGASAIYVYETGGSNQNVIDTWNQIATDGLANQISTSYWWFERTAPHSFLQSESQAFKQMASEGQSMFSASGDHGEYEASGGSNEYQDPALQPWVTAVGGTDMTLNANGTYDTETGDAGSGGGPSTYWPEPAYQQGFLTPVSGLLNRRNVPDVSLCMGNPYYDIYSSGSWGAWGGTSAASPLWAAFTSLVNQKRTQNGIGLLGFPDETLYRIARGNNYGNAFHDIQTGNNGYAAGVGYDNVTGLGTINGVTTLATLTAATGPLGELGYTVQDLGTLGGASSEPAGSDNLGDVVGNSYDSSSNYDGFFWNASSDSMFPIPDTLGGAESSVVPQGMSTHTFGNIPEWTTGYANTSSGASDGFLYNGTDMTDMGLLAGGSFSEGLGVNDQGQVAGVADSSTSSQTAVEWTSSGLTNLGTLPGGTYSTASGIDDGGDVVGLSDSSTSNGYSHATMWPTGGGAAQDLGAIGGTGSQAQAINDWQEAVGWYNGSSGYDEAFTWTSAAGMQTLDLNGTFPESLAFGINDGTNVDDGAVVGDAVTNVTTGTQVGFVTTPFGLDDLNNMTPPVSGCTIDNAYSIDDYGRIAGSRNCNSDDHAVLMSPITLEPLSASISGQSVTVTGNISAPAPPNEVIVSLGSSDPTIIGVPSDEEIDGGSQSFSFTENIASVTSPTTVVLAATYGTTTQFVIVQPTPAPTATSLSPSAALSGGSSFTLTVNGTNFGNAAVVRWNGASLATTFVSTTQLTATVPASDIAATGTATVTVFNPAPGGGTSNGLTFSIQSLTPPTGLSATAGNGQITLHWSTSTYATSYNIYRGTASNGEGATPIAGTTGTSLVDSSVTNGTKYYYKLASVSSLGTSALSSEVSATPTGPPPTPTGLAATAGNTQIILNWNSSTGATSYTLYRSTASGTETSYKTGITTTSYTDTGLTNGVKYYYKLAAVNSAGTSAESGEVSGTPAGVPPTPTGLAATAGNAQVILNWNPSTGATSYTLYRSTASGTETSYKTGITTTSYTDTGLTNGVKYYYKLAAVDAAGTSAQSSEVSATPAGAPPTPTGLAATAGNAQVILNWNASTGATSYTLYRSTASGAETSYKTGITTTAYTDTGLTNGTTYYYTVAAVDSVGTSPQSGQVSATPNAGVYINCGGPLVSPFVADTDFSGGATIDHANTISTTGVTNPAPVAVYQSGRDDNFSYTIPGFTAGSGHTVRLHFCETYFNGAGDRTFNVSINGTQVLTDFDIWKTAGAENQALIVQFTENANTSGQYVITFTSVVNNALVSGIEIH